MSIPSQSPQQQDSSSHTPAPPSPSRFDALWGLFIIVGLIILTIAGLFGAIFGIVQLAAAFGVCVASIGALGVFMANDTTRKWMRATGHWLGQRPRYFGKQGERLADFLQRNGQRLHAHVHGRGLAIIIACCVALAFFIWNILLSFSYHNITLEWIFSVLGLFSLVVCIILGISSIRAARPQPGGSSVGTQGQQPGGPPVGTQPRPTPWKQGSLLLLLAVIILSGLGNFYLYRFADACNGAPAPGPASPYGGVTYGTQCIGLSDGTVIFDADQGRTDADKKLQAARLLRSGDSTDAQPLFADAASADPTDAEALIYSEDITARRAASHMTLVVDATLSGIYIRDGRDTLQGVYIAQKEYDTHCLLILRHCPLLNLVIANTGSGTLDTSAYVATGSGMPDESAFAPMVATWILQTAQHDSTIIGVIDGLASQATLKVNSMLSDQTMHILPMVAAKATSDYLNPVPHFLRVVPPNMEQGQNAAQYALHVLNVKKVVILFRDDSTYSGNLKDSFQQSFKGNDLSKIVDIKSYPAGDSNTLQNEAQSFIQKYHDLDLIYCACYVNEVDAILRNLPENQSDAHLKIMGGDAFLELGDFTPDTWPHLSHVLFTSLAYPNLGELYPSGFQGNATFFADYGQAFEPTVLHPERATGFKKLTAGIMQSYDAALVFTIACEQMPVPCGAGLSPGVLERQLFAVHWDATDPRGGITGSLSFASNGNPVQKAIYMLSFDKTNTADDSALRCERIYGQFLSSNQPAAEAGQPCSV